MSLENMQILVVLIANFFDAPSQIFIINLLLFLRIYGSFGPAKALSSLAPFLVSSLELSNVISANSLFNKFIPGLFPVIILGGTFGFFLPLREFLGGW